MAWKQVLPYWGAQTAGALCAAPALALRLLFPLHPDMGSTAPSGPVWQSFMLEIILSFILMFFILNVSTGHREKE
jgi:aquaporin Z